MNLLLFLQLTRPKTLIAAAAPVLLTYASCYRIGLISVKSTFLFLLTLLTAVLLQVLANFLNDYYDLLSGVDRDRSKYAPPRLLLTGQMNVAILKRYTRYLLFLITALGSVLVLNSNVWVLLIGLVSILVAGLYSYGKQSLASLGLGEVVTMIFFGIIPTFGTALILAPGVIPVVELLPISLFCGTSSVLILLANNLRDHASDLRNGKRTIVVRFGILNNLKLFVAMSCLALVLFMLQLPKGSPFLLRLGLIGACFWKLIQLISTTFDVSSNHQTREMYAARLLPLAGGAYMLATILLVLINFW